ncbi:MAG: LysE family translocator [Acidimicrobiia bacterium]|nr:LysE family translocator [Acidimicrobiia bacterium]
MPSSSTLLAFSAAAFALIVVPGPSVLFVVSRALALGRRAALLTVVGNAAGAYTQVLFVALGLGAVVQRSIVIYDVVKLVGAAYLVFLGVQAIRHRHDSSFVADAAVVPRPPWRVMRDGFVVGVANPKVIVFFAAILPQFIDKDGAPAGVQMAVLGLIFVAIALVSDSTWGLMSGTARQWFASRPKRIGRLGATGGTVMIGLGLRLALTRRSD